MWNSGVTKYVASSTEGDAGRLSSQVAAMDDLLQCMEEEFTFLRKDCGSNDDLRQLLFAAEHRLQRATNAMISHEKDAPLLTLPSISQPHASPTSESRPEGFPVRDATATSSQPSGRRTHAVASAGDRAPVAPGEAYKMAFESRLLTKNPLNTLARERLERKYGVSRGPSSQRVALGPAPHPDHTKKLKRQRPMIGRPTVLHHTTTNGKREPRADAMVELNSSTGAALADGHANMLPPPLRHSGLPLHKYGDQFKQRFILDDGFTPGIKRQQVPDSDLQKQSSPRRLTESDQCDAEISSISVLPSPRDSNDHGGAATGTCFDLDAGRDTDELWRVNIRVKGGDIVRNEEYHDLMTRCGVHVATIGDLLSTFRTITRVLRDKGVEDALLDGQEVLATTARFPLTTCPEQALLKCVRSPNVSTIPPYSGKSGKARAAVRIQAWFRRHLVQKFYWGVKRQLWAVQVFERAWRTRSRYLQTKQRIIEAQQARVKKCDKLRSKLAETWPRIEGSKRVVIHIASLDRSATGVKRQYEECGRDFWQEQGQDLIRICDIKDPNVEVVYVSVEPLNEHARNYLINLLGSEDEDALKKRLRVIVPTAMEQYGHRFSLAEVLCMSYKTLRRIRNFTTGKDAYIVPQVVTSAEIELSAVLGIPLLCPSQAAAKRISCRVSAMELVQCAGLSPAPGAGHAAQSGLSFLFEVFADLVVAHPEINRWLFKCQMLFNGEGIAYVDIGGISLIAEFRGRDTNLTKGQVDELREVLSTHVLARLVLPRTWRAPGTSAAFLRVFDKRGGRIEATPPCGPTSCVTADVLVCPSGDIRLLTACEQVRSDPFSVWGYTLPQTALGPQRLKSIAGGLGTACWECGCHGYVTFDVATFMLNDEVQTWVTGLKSGYSPSVMMTNAVLGIAGGALDMSSGLFETSVVPPVENRIQRRYCEVLGRVKSALQPVAAERYCCFSNTLSHANLAVLHFPVFFAMCRANGIAYDPQTKTGTVCAVRGSFTHGSVGFICIEKTPQAALQRMLMSINHTQESLTVQNIAGTNNFGMARCAVERSLFPQTR